MCDVTNGVIPFMLDGWGGHSWVPGCGRSCWEDATLGDDVDRGPLVIRGRILTALKRTSLVLTSLLMAADNRNDPGCAGENASVRLRRTWSRRGHLLLSGRAQPKAEMLGIAVRRDDVGFTDVTNRASSTGTTGLVPADSLDDVSRAVAAPTGIL